MSLRAARRRIVLFANFSLAECATIAENIEPRGDGSFKYQFAGGIVPGSRFVLLFLCCIAAVLAIVITHRPLLHPKRASTANTLGAGNISGMSSAANARIVESYGKLPLSFELNQG